LHAFRFVRLLAISAKFANRKASSFRPALFAARLSAVGTVLISPFGAIPLRWRHFNVI